MAPQVLGTVLPLKRKFAGFPLRTDTTSGSNQRDMIQVRLVVLDQCR